MIDQAMHGLKFSSQAARVTPILERREPASWSFLPDWRLGAQDLAKV